MKIEIMSRENAAKQLEKEPPDTAIIIIAMSSFELEYPIFLNWERKLIVYFSDIMKEDHPNAMTPQHAEEIKDFVLSLVGCCEKLIISCYMGISRSSAVAAGIMIGLDRDDMEIWNNIKYYPNILCYRRMLTAFGKPTDSADEKKKINENLHDSKAEIIIMEEYKQYAEKTEKAGS